ncbi:MAG TPA: N-acetyl-gamma-glutamyl-phosphate reductase [Firmicutes bacterium]|nr:N-acetyl-gamma-glutamyl-phosphate reductase [Bacillota bacterium]
MTIKVGILGATGYTGAELVRLLLRHGEAEIAAVGSNNFVGRRLSEIYPNLKGIFDMECVSQDAVIDCSDVIFACLPHGLSQEAASKCIAAGKVFIDLGADFRLEDEAQYKEWYGGSFEDHVLHSEAVYALPELFREQIVGKKLISCPGCYPTASELALFPAIKRGLVETDAIVIDAKSGVTGAGRDHKPFAECNEGMSAYKVAQHRHTPEIEQTLMKAANKRIRLTFVPHLLPINRGVSCTCYARLKLGATEERIREAYEDFYKDEYFIRLLLNGETANVKNVRMSNMCEISLHIDRRTGMLIVTSAIDNMIKGSVGQAVQNMNIVMGLDEKTGLDYIPPAF